MFDSNPNGDERASVWFELNGERRGCTFTTSRWDSDMVHGPACIRLLIERGRIESDAPMSFHVDGEPADGGTALDIRVLPKALTVIS